MSGLSQVRRVDIAHVSAEVNKPGLSGSLAQAKELSAQVEEKCQELRALASQLPRSERARFIQKINTVAGEAIGQLQLLGENKSLYKEMLDRTTYAIEVQLTCIKNSFFPQEKSDNPFDIVDRKISSISCRAMNFYPFQAFDDGTYTHCISEDSQAMADVAKIRQARDKALPRCMELEEDERKACIRLIKEEAEDGEQIVCQKSAADRHVKYLEHQRDSLLQRISRKKDAVHSF